MVRRRRAAEHDRRRGGLQGVAVKSPKRVSLFGKMLLSMALMPPVVAAGSFLSAGHPYIGGVLTAYGVIWSVVGLIVGGIGSLELGFFTEEYRSSLRQANRDISELTLRLESETALRRKFQDALTDGDRT